MQTHFFSVIFSNTFSKYYKKPLPAKARGMSTSLKFRGRSKPGKKNKEMVIKIKTISKIVHSQYQNEYLWG